jgi:hypothetical protein
MLGLAAFIVLVSYPLLYYEEADEQIATLFFWLSTFSTPFIKSIYYLETRANDVRVSPLYS